MARNENIRPTKQFLVTVPDPDPGISAGHVEMSMVDQDSYVVSEILPSSFVELRDQFAMAALTGIAIRHTPDDLGTWLDKFSEICYEIADAMMEARKPVPSGDKVGGE